MSRSRSAITWVASLFLAFGIGPLNAQPIEEWNLTFTVGWVPGQTVPPGVFQNSAQLSWGFPLPSRLEIESIGGGNVKTSGVAGRVLGDEGTILKTIDVIHTNNPIIFGDPTLQRSAIMFVNVLTPVVPGGAPFGPIQLQIPVTFAETLNPGPCAGGTAPPCADIFVVGAVAFDIPFEVDGVQYFFSGFPLEANSFPVLDPEQCIAAGAQPGCIGFTTEEGVATIQPFGVAITTAPILGSLQVQKRTNGADADFPDAPGVPQIAPGGPVTWTYEVRNSGQVKLLDVIVTDDSGTPGDPADDLCTANGTCANPVISCPADMLDVGEFMTCTAPAASALALDSGNTTVMGLCGDEVGIPMYANRAVAVATSEETGEEVPPAENRSHYCNPAVVEMGFEKATNGASASDPNQPGVPLVAPGALVTWTYEVTNTGNRKLVDVVVTDDFGTPGNSADDLCTANGTCANPGAISCPSDMLDVGESMTCSASANALLLTGANTSVVGLCGNEPGVPMYENRAVAVASSEQTGEEVSLEDRSHYCNPPEVGLEFQKATNGSDADDPAAPGVPQIVPGALVTWSYEVTNIGNRKLVVVVTDDFGTPGNSADDLCTSNGTCANPGAISCPSSMLDPGEAMTCSASASALVLTGANTSVVGLCGNEPGQPIYENRAEAVGTTEGGIEVTEEDLSHYCNPETPLIDIQKATNGVRTGNRNDPGIPGIDAGSLVTWTYEVTNAGNRKLVDVVVTDDFGTPGNSADDLCTSNGTCANPGAINCPSDMLEVSGAMTCSASAVALDLASSGVSVDGLCGGLSGAPVYENRAVAVAMSEQSGAEVTEDDLGHYCNSQAPGPECLDIDLAEKVLFTAAEAHAGILAAFTDAVEGCNWRFDWDVGVAGDGRTGFSTVDDHTVIVSTSAHTFSGSRLLVSDLPGEIGDTRVGDLCTLPRAATMEGEFVWSFDGTMLYGSEDFCLDTSTYGQEIVKDFFFDAAQLLEQTSQCVIFDRGIEVIVKERPETCPENLDLEDCIGGEETLVRFPRGKWSQTSRHVAPNGALGSIRIQKIRIAPDGAPSALIIMEAILDRDGAGIDSFDGSATCVSLD